MSDRSGPQGSDPPPPPHMDEDLISGLPDELLHAILVRLGSARAAARTSVLSRRWSHVWHHMPEILLNLRTEGVPTSSFLDAVDGALAGCLAPTLERLSIPLSARRDLTAPPGRAASWLRFAAERVAGELILFVVLWQAPPFLAGDHIEEVELEVPACGRVKEITLFPQDGWRLRLLPDGLFTALTALRIHYGRMEASELSTLVCTRCPRLTNLSLSVVLIAVADISIRSDSLRSLSFHAMNTRRLEVVAPRLEELTLYESIQAHVSAPNLAKLSWRGGAYDPHSHRFHDVGRRLWLLDIGLNCAAPTLMRQFNEVDVLILTIYIRQGIAGYQSFLNETRMLPKCNTLRLSLFRNYHGLAPVILHPLRSCNGTRKFSLALFPLNDSLMHPVPSSCPCCLEESYRIDDIDLNSLDEVEISSSKISNVEQEFLETLSRCNARVLKKLVINCMMSTVPPETKEVCEKVRGMYGSNVEVEFYMFPDGIVNGRRERFFSNVNCNVIH